MARRRAAPRRRSGSKKFPGWALVLVGLIAGSAIAWGVHLYTERTAARNPPARAAITPPPETPAQPPVEEQKPKTAQPQKPRFDFYTILPANESVVPDKERKARPAKPPKAEEGTRYILQAASYARQEEADQLRAKLALNGLEARIEKIAIEGKGEYYRVRLGPYAKVEDADAPSRQLAQLGVKGILIKVRKSPGA